MSTKDTSDIPSVRDTIIQSVVETADRQPDNRDLQLSAERLERNERLRDGDSSRVEQKEAKTSDKDPGDTGEADSSLRKELKTQLKPAASTDETLDSEIVDDDKDKSTKDEHTEVSRDKDAASTRNVAAKLPKDVAAEYDSLPSATKNFLARQVKENNDLKANMGRRAYLNDVDKVLEPVMPVLKQAGASPAQLVQRILMYSDALSSPQHQAAALVQIARDFKIDLVGVAQMLNDHEAEQSQLPPAHRDLNAKLDQMMEMLSYQDRQALLLQQQQQNVAADEKAKTTLGTWANKAGAQHFENRAVQSKMHELISSYTGLYVGEQFADTGGINLRKAYADACEALGESQPFKAKTQTAGSRNSHQQQRRQSGSAPPVSGKPKVVTTRDSIRLAMQQLKQQGAQG